MFEISTSKNDAIFKALGDKPGKIYSGIDTDRGENRSGVHPTIYDILGKGPELREIN
jgi:hypothetical protein